MHECIEKFNVILEKDLKEELENVTKVGTVTPEKLKVIDNAVEVMLKLKEYEQWLNEGNDGYSYNDGYSNRRGRSATTGRYVSRDYAPRSYNDGSYSGRRSYGYPGEPYMRGSYDPGYSGHSMKDRLIADLESKYDQAQSEHERQFLDNWIKRIEMEK